MAWRRKKWLRCTKLKICTILIAGLILTAVFKVYSLLETTRCSNGEMQENFKQLCHQYKESQVYSDLCNQLCITHEVWPQQCLGSRLGKQIAAAKWQNDIIILKSAKRFFHDFDVLGSFDRKSQAYILPSNEMFFMLLHGTVTSHLGKAVPETGSKLLARMWPDNYRHFLDHRNNTTQYHAGAMNAVWSLTQQSEYVLLRYFNENKYLPRVLGTCGHFYAVEYAPSGLMDPVLLDFTTSTTWRKRAQLALGILRVLSSFEKDFPEPLHMCDIKGGNFGVARDGTVKVIDVDTVFFRSDLESQFDRNCTGHKDCDFFDCQAWCDVTTQQCQKKVLNNNLQVVCEKIFKGSTSNLHRGLLSNSPQQWTVQLQKLLDHCANPTDNNTDRRGAANAENLYKLQLLLKMTMF